MIRIAFIGCVTFSYEMLKHLLTLKHVQVEAVVTKSQSTFNADFCSLADLAEQHGIPYYYAAGNDQEEMSTWLDRFQLDAVFYFGWSHLLSEKIIKKTKYGAIGYHPAALPKNRGRHPIIWALALGLPETASTFFVMDEGSDSGEIISQEKVLIDPNDDAQDLYRKLIQIAKKQVSQFTLEMCNNTLKRIPQDHTKANYWRKRNKSDGLIDWRMSASSIHNLLHGN